MAIQRSRVFKDKDGYWVSRVFFVDKQFGISTRIFRSRIFERALKHAFTNS